MIQKNPLEPRASVTTASRAKRDTPNTPPDPDTIRYGGKPPKSERTSQTTAASQTTALPTAASQTTAPSMAPKPAQSMALSSAVAAPTPVALSSTPVVLLAASKAVSSQVVSPPVPLPEQTTAVPKQTAGGQTQTAGGQTQTAPGSVPKPSRRSLASRYNVFPYGVGLLPDPGPPTGPEHWGLDYPPPGGPVLALVGQYGLPTRWGTARLLSVSYACNFRLEPPSSLPPGQPDSLPPGQPDGPPPGQPDSRYTVGVLMPTDTAPYRPNLGHLIGFALREAGVSPKRFQSPKRLETVQPGAVPDTLTVLLHFGEPGGEMLRRVFDPCLPRSPLPARLVVSVPDLRGRSHQMRVGAYDARRLSGLHSLADAQFFLAIDRGREASGGMALVSRLLADPASVLASDPEGYGQAAAQMARLVILGRRGYSLPDLP